jgi:molybdate transport system ATP-binding protein
VEGLRGALAVDVRCAYAGGALVEAALEVPVGVTVLFGPSGCGKTTLLRLIAGLVRPTRGTIRMGDRVWDDVGAGIHRPPQARRVGYLPQEGRLFPHLTVAGNLAFGLHGWAEAARARRVRELLVLLGLEGLAHRRPAALSGGQRQRAALGRALAPEPRVLLLDEPLSALDRPEQRRLQVELQGLLPTFDIPCLWVTHNRHEAHLMGHRAVVMDGGRVLQCGEITDIFDRPAHPKVARLFGMANLLPGTAHPEGPGRLRVQVGDLVFQVDHPGGLGEAVWVGLRGEDFLLARTETVREGWVALPGRVLSLEDEGALVRVRVDAGQDLEARLTRAAFRESPFAPGDPVWLHFRLESLHLLPR